MFYELTYLDLPIRFHSGAAATIADDIGASPDHGQIMGCWASDVGVLNRIALLRSFPTEAALAADRRRVLAQRNPFNLTEGLTGLTFEAYRAFEGIVGVGPGQYGPWYEIRTYGMRLGGLERIQEAWNRAVPGRIKLSPLVVVMYALDGMPRFTHIWAYRSLDERFRIRSEAVDKGLWPPNAFPGSMPPPMQNALYRPLSISPLT